MMEVFWLQSALDDLARLWMAADSALRAAITAAAHRIDPALQHDPASKGESRELDERVFFAYPLGILFTVVEAQQAVFVHSVWRYRRRGE